MVTDIANPQNSKQKRILNDLLAQVDQLYPSSSDQVSVNRMLAYNIRMEKIMMNEIQGFFSKNELMAIIDANNGVMITPPFWGNPTAMVLSLEDAETLDGLGTKWEINIHDLNKKLLKMPRSLFLFLHEQIYRFWQERNGADLEGFVKSLL